MMLFLPPVRVVRLGGVICAAWLALVGAAALGAETPPHLLRYLEGLDALSEGRWADSVAIFDEVAQAAGRDGRPAMARGVALTMTGRYQEAANSFLDAQNLGMRGREPSLWTYIIARMANRNFVGGQGIQAPRSLGGGSFFSGVPGHMLQGGDDYPTDYASFLYYRMATLIGEARERGHSLDTPKIRQGIRDGASWFANRARAAPDLSLPLYKRAEALAGNGRFKTALELIAIVRVSYPDDWLTAALASDCWVGLGRHATARREATLALSYQPENAYALLRRAVAGARIGRVDAARADLKLATTFDRQLAPSVRDSIQRVIDQNHAAADAAALRRTLTRRVEAGESDSAIAETAQALAKAVERTRSYYDEYYASEVGRWMKQIRERPRDPAPLAALASFIVDEARTDRRGEALETGRAIVPYRSAVDNARDLRRALGLVDQAVALDASHVGALVQRARALDRLGDHANAEKVVAHVLRIAPKDPQALRLQGAFWIDRANQMFAQAAAMRMPIVSTNSWTESRSDGVWRVTQTTTQQPSQADLANADRMDAQARQLLQRARTAIDKALAATRGTLEGDLLAADVALSEQRWAVADMSARAALKRNPRSLTAHDIIVDAFQRSGQPDRADHARSERANVFQTTAGWKLKLAWRAIERRDLPAATRLLVEAEKLDPADGRIDALRGEVARLNNRREEALTSWRIALALAEARTALDAQPTASPQPVVPRDPLEFGLALAMRDRLAAGTAAEKALALFRANGATGDYLPPGGGAAEMFTAMLPDPNAPRIPVPRPRNMSDWLVLSHVGAGRLFLAAKRSDDALAEYRAASRYAPPGGNDRIPNIADKRGNRRNSNFAAYSTSPEVGEALLALARDAVRRRDVEAARVYLEQAVAAPISREQRQEVNELQMQIARIYQSR